MLAGIVRVVLDFDVYTRVRATTDFLDLAVDICNRICGLRFGMDRENWVGAGWWWERGGGRRCGGEMSSIRVVGGVGAGGGGGGEREAGGGMHTRRSSDR